MPETRSVAMARTRWEAVWRCWGPVLTRQWRTWRLVAGSSAVGLAVAVTSVAVAGPWDDGHRRAEHRRALAAPKADDDGRRDGRRPSGDRAVPVAVLTPVDVEAGGSARADEGEVPMPARAALSKLLKPLLDDPALGSPTTAAVLDVATGKQLFASDAGKDVIPASTIKLVTATAALSALGPDHRIATRVRWDADDRRVVLVGGGDPTLSRKRLGELADDTARALRQRKGGPVAVRYDTHRYAGPSQHPMGPNANIAPVSALMVNAGRLDDSEHGPAPRSTDPAGDAAADFAEMLRDRDVATKGGTAPVERPARGEELASSRSAPLSALVERTLTESDNDLAEALARQVALATGEKASFAGASRAVRSTLATLRLPLSGTRFADGSGLRSTDRVSAELLTELLARAADPDHPELRPVLTGLPVAGFSGTLSRRYGGKAAGAGLVHAKTGTLTGVNTLAGTVVDADGRLLAFAFLANGTASRSAAHTALDRLASAVADCGCR